MAKAPKGATLGRLQAAARQTRTALAARLLQQGLYAGQDQIMLALAGDEGQTPGKLASQLGVRPPTITKTINRLQSQGFLERRSNDSDSRQANIYLTDAGRETIRTIEKSLRRTEKQALRGIDRKEQKALLKMLARIESNLLNLDIAADADETPEDETEE